MPELPEVHTTVEGLKKVIVGKTIKDVWSDFHIGTAHSHRNNLKNENHFKNLRKIAIGAKIKSVERKGKNILIHLSPRSNPKTNPKSQTLGYTIVVHMKMTGHLMVENYEKEKKFIHFSVSLSGNKHLVLSDMRKFASVCIVRDSELKNHEGLSFLGPDPLQIAKKEFIERIRTKESMPIKKVLLDQTVLAGIGNIYSDEILWASGVHPLSKPSKIPEKILAKMFVEAKKILKKSIKYGGDSMSDYLNAFGNKGKFQNFHKAYRRTGQNCPKANCGGIIDKKVVGGRSAHFCSKHQIKYF